ncbi:uncharacterized protein LOC118437120 [Folsomia candida]|uniref:uncharacterized protein LOC118437120 n=1 Tax=Folsomia candida TaxID=158441 RepID=UPI0016053420|nr:uncharacterized protein LOC118437120 [Folsomia candida]
MENPAMEKGLMNPLIIDNIFSHLDFTTLTSARLVCTVWADISTPMVVRKGLLTFSDFKSMTVFNPKLATNVSIFLDYNCDCMPNFGRILKADPQSLDTISMSAISNLLTELHLSAGDQVCVGRGSPGELSGTTLKILKYRYVDRNKSYRISNLDPYYVPWIDFSLSKILERFANSLEKLELGPSDFETAQILNFSALHLTHLNIHDAEQYDLKNFLDVAHVPKLTHLSVRHHHISQLFKTCHVSHSAVMSLELDTSTYCNKEDILAAAKIAYIFPSVTEFKIILKVEPYPEVFTTDLAEAMGSFRSWELNRGVIVIEGVSPDVAAAVMEGLMEWRCLKNTSLRFKKSPEFDNFEMTDRVRDALVSCRSIRHIDMSRLSMDEQARNDLKELIARWNLKIST